MVEHHAQQSREAIEVRARADGLTLADQVADGMQAVIDEVGIDLRPQHLQLQQAINFLDPLFLALQFSIEALEDLGVASFLPQVPPDEQNPREEQRRQCDASVELHVANAKALCVLPRFRIKALDLLLLQLCLESLFELQVLLVEAALEQCVLQITRALHHRIGPGDVADGIERVGA